MTAPQRPAETPAETSAETPIWTAPPPGDPPPRRGRPVWAITILAVAVVAAAALIVAGGPLREIVSGLQGADDPTEADSDPATPEDPPADASPADQQPGPEPEAEPPVDPALAELRASDRYVALAEHERAAAAVAAGVEQLGWNNFAIVDGGQAVHEWTNKAELWDQVVPPLRDELLLLGEPYTEPMWDETNPSPASIGAHWIDQDTGGRGQYIAVYGRYYDEERETAVALTWGVLIATHADGSGEVVAQMPPIELVASQATNFRHANELTSSAAWEWVYRQPVVDGGDG